MRSTYVAILLVVSVFHVPDGSEAQLNPTPVENFDKNCHSAFGGPNFFAWVVRIAVESWFLAEDPETFLPDRYIATGNIITEDYVLTACTPFAVIIEQERWDLVRVLPAVTEYTTVLPVKEKGVFPWAKPDSKLGCIVGHYSVHNEVRVTERVCDKHSGDYPNTMSHNMILLRMASRIEVGDYKLFPRMPFNYNVEPLVRKIDWLNTYRKARCVIGRIKDVIHSKDKEGNDVVTYTNLFEGSNFHYAALPYRSNCIGELCRKNCSHLFEAGLECILEHVMKEERQVCKDLEVCWLGCLKVMEPFIGTLMCLKRMRENGPSVTEPFSITYDFDNVQTQIPYWEGDSCAPSTPHPATTEPTFMGAPVVCDGEVIAVVTKCESDFLVATSIVSIRHRLLKLFDTSYEKDLVFLTDG